MVAGVGVVELLILVVILLLVVPFGIYWIIRLATRHGAEDARRQQGGAPGPPA
jgi:hypothetical protein